MKEFPFRPIREQSKIYSQDLDTAVQTQTPRGGLQEKDSTQLELRAANHQRVKTELIGRSDS